MALDLPKLVAELSGTAWAICRVSGHRALDERGHVLRQSLFAQVGNRLRRDPQELSHHLLPASAFESSVAGECAEKGCPKRIHVRCRGRRLALENLGGGERRRPGDHAGRGLKAPGNARDAEVRQLRFAIVGQQDVSRFDIAMQSAHAVRGFECTSQLDADAERLHPIEGSVLADQGFQRILLVIGHYQVWTAARDGADLHDVDNVRVTGQPPHGALFPQKSFEVLGVEVGIQHLDSDGAVECRLRAAVYNAETAAADLFDLIETLATKFRGDIRDQTPLRCKRIALGHRCHPQPVGNAPLPAHTAGHCGVVP